MADGRPPGQRTRPPGSRVTGRTSGPVDTSRCALANRTAPDDDWLEWNLGRARAAADLPGPTLTPTELATLCPDS